MGGSGDWPVLQEAASHLYTVQGRHEEALKLMLQVGGGAGPQAAGCGFRVSLACRKGRALACRSANAVRAGWMPVAAIPSCCNSYQLFPFAAPAAAQPGRVRLHCPPRPHRPHLALCSRWVVGGFAGWPELGWAGRCCCGLGRTSGQFTVHMPRSASSGLTPCRRPASHA